MEQFENMIPSLHLQSADTESNFSQFRMLQGSFLSNLTLDDLESSIYSNVIRIIPVKSEPNQSILKIWPQVSLWPLWRWKFNLFRMLSGSLLSNLTPTGTFWKCYPSWPLTSDDTESSVNSGCYKDHSCQIWAQPKHFEYLTSSWPWPWMTLRVSSILFTMLWSFLSNLSQIHRCTREIPKPAPFLSRHGAQIVGLWVSPVIKITVVRQVRMSPASTAVLA